MSQHNTTTTQEANTANCIDLIIEQVLSQIIAYTKHFSEAEILFTRYDKYSASFHLCVESEGQIAIPHFDFKYKTVTRVTPNGLVIVQLFGDLS